MSDRPPSVPDETLTYDDEQRSAAAPPPADAETPESRYVLGEEHARGGIGRILRARDLKLGRDVAIKELISSSPRAQARFEREARITARLEHPAIVPIHDAGRWSDTGRPYLAMKLVSGRSLKQAIAETRTLRERLALLSSVITVAEAIGYAHSVGVIHRDLKPSNVLVGDFGETVVIDWGLAKELDREDADDPLEAGPYRAVGDHVTVAGAVLGTPAFMSPEQARGHGVDQRSDVYALGALLYYLLAGKTPYDGSSDDVVAMVREGPPAPLAETIAGVPPDLAAIVDKAMAREPADRYPDGAALAEDLRKFRTGQLVGAHDYSWAQLVGRWARRNRAVTAAFVLFLAALTGASAWFLSREQGLRRDAEAERDRAEAERDRADTQTLALLEQQGRIELEAGRPFRAAVYLAEALRRAPERAPARWMVSEALRGLRAHVRRFSGHQRDVVGVDISRDGLRVATAGTDGTVRLWELSTGRELRVLDLGGPGESVAFSPDGSMVAAGEGGRTVVWNTSTGERVYEVAVGGYRLAFSSDGAYLAIGAKESDLLVVAADSGRIERQWKVRDGRVSGVAWHPTRRRLFGLSETGEVVSWDVDDSDAPRRVAEHDEPLSSVSVSPDGRRLLVSTYHEGYFILDAATGAQVTRRRLPDGTQIADVAYRPDGVTLVAGAIDGRVRLVHAASGNTLAAFDTLPAGRLNQLALGPTGARLATVGVDGGANLWRLDGFGFRVRPIGEGPDAGYLGACTWLDEGRMYGVGTYDGTISVRDARSDEVLRSVDVDSDVFYQGFDRTGSRMVFNGAVNPQPPISMWDMEKGERIVTFREHVGRVYHTEATADGRVVATAGKDGTVRQWSFASGAPVGAVLRATSGRRFSAVSYSPDGQLIATADENGVLQLWAPRSGDLLRSIEAHPSWIQDIAFSPDGATVATAGRLDLTARLWDVRTGENRLTVPAQRGNVMVIGFAPSGEVFATTGTDDVLNLRDGRSGALLRSIEGPRICLAFHPDRTEILTGGPDEYLVSWDYSVDERSPDEIHAEVARLSPWRLDGGRLVVADSN